MECPYCGCPNMLKSGFVGDRQQYFCKMCNRKYTEGAVVRAKRNQKGKKTRRCVHCGKLTENPKFCSQSCAATYNNLNNQERYEERRQNKRRYYCKHCGVEITSRRTTCGNCNPHIVFWDTVTLAEVADRASYQVHAHIRQRARYIYRNSHRPKYCVNCGYDKHIEICHIRAIADFPPETVVSEINDLQNLVALCPNCHWELDNGVLPIEVIQTKNAAI